MVSAQLCFACANVYGAIGALEQDHREIHKFVQNKGWDSDGARDIGESLERIALELTKLADAVVA